ncbi:MAG: hypothetical protein ACJ72M_13975 [Propionibacteriaceae bacterium]
MSQESEHATAVQPAVLAAAQAIVRALHTGSGRSNICDSEAELQHRLSEDGALISDEDFSAALDALERNGSPTGYDLGQLPGLPYKVVRPESRLQRSRLNPNPPRGIVLKGLRPY